MINVWRSVFITFIIFTFVLPFIVVGQVRESTNYKIERDSLNVGGGFTSSGNFQMESSVGELGTGFSTSTNYILSAGYQQNLEEIYIAISSPSDLTLDSINGLTGGFSTSSTSWNITTNNNSGYEVSIRSSTTPAMQSNLDYFEDYSPSGSNPDFDFSINNSTAAFGFSPNSTHVIPRFKNDGNDCNIGTSITLYKCWDGLSISDTTIIQSGSPNHPYGTLSTITFRAESGSNKILTAGDYSATIIMTAIAL
jgi:hypothetical protein